MSLQLLIYAAENITQISKAQERPNSNSLSPENTSFGDEL